MNLDSPEHNPTAALSSCHLLCSSCKATLHVNQEIFLGQGFLMKCPNCQYPVSIRNIYSHDGISVSELFGCRYLGKDLTFNLQEQVRDWITDSISFHAPADATPVTDEEIQTADPLDIDLASQWDVETTKGKKISFPQFQDLRDAISRGEIVRGDVIVSAAGIKHPVEHYPGSADLFGNAPAINTTEYSMLPKSERVLAWHQQIPWVKVLLALGISLGLTLPFAWPRYQIYRGSQTLSKAVLGASPTTRTLTQVLEDAIRILTQAQRAKYVALLDELLATFKTYPSHTELIPYISVVASQLSATGSSHPLAKQASALLKYAQEIEPASPLLVLSEAVLTYHDGHTSEAVSALADLPLQDRDVYLMGAAFLDTQGDPEGAATLYLPIYEAYSQDQRVLESLLASMERNQKFPEAIGYAQRLVSLFPQDAQHSEKLKQMLRQVGRFDELESVLRQELLRRPQQESIHLELIRVLAQLKSHDRTAEAAREFLAKFPSSTQKTEAQFLLLQAENALAVQPQKGSPTPDAQPQQRTTRRRRRRG